MDDFHPTLKITSIEQFQIFFDLVSDMVFLFTPASYHLISANQAFFAGLCLPTEVKGLDLTSIIPPKDIKALTNGAQINTKLKKKKKGHLEVQLKVYSVQLGNQPVFLGTANKLPVDERISDENKAAEEEKRVLLNEVYHRAKNNLNVMLSLLSLQLNRIKDPATRHLFLKNKNRIFVLAYLQQKLYESPRTSEIKSKDYLFNIVSQTVSTFRVGNKNIQLNINVEDCWLHVEKLVPLGLIINELVTNSVVHAFPEQDKREIQVSFYRNNGEEFALHIKDNGIGFLTGEKFEKQSKNLGWQLVLNLARQLRATTEIETFPNKGVQVHILLKLRSNE